MSLTYGYFGMRRRLPSSALLAAALACSPGAGGDSPHADGDNAPARPAAPDWTVRRDGVGPLRYGMPVAEARAALGDTLGDPPPTDRCVSFVPAAVPVGLRLMLENGNLVRVDVDSAGIRTTAGAEVGMSEAEIRARYPSGLEQRPHKYDTAGRYLIYRAPADSSQRVVFEMNEQRVLRYHAGLMPAVEYVEGCG
ncbi:MAG: lectin [Gemmatimonadales bacterium]